MKIDNFKQLKTPKKSKRFVLSKIKTTKFGPKWTSQQKNEEKKATI